MTTRNTPPTDKNAALAAALRDLLESAQAARYHLLKAPADGDISYVRDKLREDSNAARAALAELDSAA